MEISLRLFSRRLRLRLSFQFDREPAMGALDQEVKKALDEAWDGLLLSWDMAPEFFAHQGDLEAFLRAALLGAAQAIHATKENPLAGLIDNPHQEPDYAWLRLMRKATSPAAREPGNPFVGARQELAKNFGAKRSCLDAQGELRPGAVAMVRKLAPGYYVLAAQMLARRLEEAHIASATVHAARAKPPKRL